MDDQELCARLMVLEEAVSWMVSRLPARQQSDFQLVMLNIQTATPPHLAADALLRNIERLTGMAWRPDSLPETEAG